MNMFEVLSKIGNADRTLKTVEIEKFNGNLIRGTSWISKKFWTNGSPLVFVNTDCGDFVSFSEIKKITIN